MKSTHLLACALLTALAAPLNADTLNFDLSPPLGLSTQNEVPPASGDGSGGEILDGIYFDTDSNILTINVGYGSMHPGFNNLSGPATGAHLHDAPAGTNGPVIYDFIANGNHASIDAVNGGVIIASVLLDDPTEADLLAGNLYINIHTAANPDGEIRGQLVEAVNSPPILVCPSPVVAECSSAEGTPLELSIYVEDADGDQLVVAWSVDGDPRPAVVVPSGGNLTSADVPLVETFDVGVHDVAVSVDDGVAAPVTCEFTVEIVDTTPPVIHSITPSRDSLWPPNHRMKRVGFTVDAEDACSDVTWEVTDVTSNEPDNNVGDGNTNNDWEILSPDHVKLRAERAGPGSGRVYTITIEVSDASGNSATGTTEVTVPHSAGKPKKKANPFGWGGFGGGRFGGGRFPFWGR